MKLTNMDQSRQRLRPWLEAKINGGTVHGLGWLNAEKTMFKIPWKHGGKQDWTPDNSRIFMEWAKHTGRYREGIDDTDYATWKTRLRCAFNKAPDIQEVKDQTNLEAPEPFRVYNLLPKKDMMKGPASVSDTASEYDASPGTVTAADDEEMLSGGPRVENAGGVHAMFATFDQPNSGSLPSDLKGVDSLDLIPRTSTGLPISSMECDLPDVFGTSCETGWQIMGHEMNLTLYYRKSVIYEEPISNPNGSRLYYGYLPPDASLPQELIERIYGKTNCLQQIELPPPDSFMHTEKQKNVTHQLLECMHRGVIINCKDGDIEATRLCKCAVFFSSTQTNGESMKLQRDQPQKIFSFKNFMDQLHLFKIGQMSVPPSREVSLAFGQAWRFTDGQDNVLISGKVVSKLSEQKYREITSEHSLQISASNEYDKLHDMVKNNLQLNKDSPDDN